jgi:N6-adenosine-specific RNA methylase IME4
LPVAGVLADDALLALWVPSPFLAIGAHVPPVEAWGFKVFSIGFAWLKTNRDGSPRMGPGLVTRKCLEYVVLGRRGKPARLSKSVLEAIIAEPRAHSQKPDEIYARLEALTPGPYLDLFARQHRENWTVYGDQVSRFDFERPHERRPLSRGGPCIVIRLSRLGIWLSSPASGRAREPRSKMHCTGRSSGRSSIPNINYTGNFSRMRRSRLGQRDWRDGQTESIRRTESSEAVTSSPGLKGGLFATVGCWRNASCVTAITDNLVDLC